MYQLIILPPAAHFLKKIKEKPLKDLYISKNGVEGLLVLIQRDLSKY